MYLKAQCEVKYLQQLLSCKWPYESEIWVILSTKVPLMKRY